MIVRGGQKGPETIEELLGARLMARLDGLDVRTRKVFAGKLMGERRSKRRGQSVEFADYREYTPGDDIRFIDWNVYGRLDRLFIKVFLEEQDLAVHLLIDNSASMDAGEPSKRLAAQRMAMALGYVGLVKHNRVSVSVFGEEGLRTLPELRGRRNVQRLGKFLLEEVRPIGTDRAGGGVGFTDAMRRLALTRRGKGVLVLLSDMLVPEGYEEGMRYLAAGLGREAGAGRSFDTFVLQVLAPAEMDPTLEREGGLAGDLRLTDSETGETREVTVTDALLERYRARLNAYVDGLSSFCAARDMTHMLVRSDADMERLLLDALRRRGLLG